MKIFAPALHRVEDEDGPLVNLMINNFERVPGGVNAQSEIFFLVAFSFNRAIVKIHPEGMKDVLSAEFMPERGPVKLDSNFHAASIARKREGCKGGE
jgi:hypothetical protein